MGSRLNTRRLIWAFLAAGALAGVCGPPCVAAEPHPPAQLPRYDLDVSLDTASHRVHIRERVTWTNPTTHPVADLVFNFYPHYRVPAGDYLLLAKMLELLRLQPSLGIDRGGRHGVVTGARLVARDGKGINAPPSLPYEIDSETATTFRFSLPQVVNPGESVTVELDVCLHLPNKQGRWGHWNGVTYLTNALPLLAVCDDSGWRPTPFVPWAQPWFNEAGVFRARITLPAEEVLACPATTKSETRLPDGRKMIETEPFLGRDFAILCSARYKEFRGETTLPDGRTVTLRCLAFPEHAFYATEILKIVADAIPVFSDWFGAFPYPEFTVVESFFGWNGNECAGLVMIDERVFGMPHLARNYVEYLVSHETCHQWWYNVVGTNGYTEPFMDEGAAAYFTHRMLDRKRGKNNPLFEWPREASWLPNVHREDYRYGSMYLAIRNNQMQPAAQDLPRYGHVFGLFTGAYDRGSKVFGMIEDRLGEAAFLDFTRQTVAKYSWRVLRAADLRRELELYTGRDWAEFFDRWVYGKGMTDWAVEDVTVAPLGGPRPTWADRVGRRTGLIPPAAGVRYRATVIVRQIGAYTEPTVIAFKGPGGDVRRVPVGPFPQPIRFEDQDATVTPVGPDSWRVDVLLPAEPEQVEIDPDRVLLDANLGNNTWKPESRARLTPLYTMLDENDLTSAHDRWNFTAGPWVWGASYADPWYTRSTMVGLRAGANRPQEFTGGAYAAYRTDYRDLVFGVDGTLLWDKQQTGFNWEYRVGGPFGGQAGASAPQRAVAYHRWVVKPGSSTYLPPMVYYETFATYQDNFLPFTRTATPGAERWDRAWDWGWHFRANLYTPYWDPECGGWVDLMAAGGQVRLPGWTTSGQFRAELAGVQQLPDWLGPLKALRIAGRVVAMGGLPDRGEFFALGGGTLFRGYDLAQRQGSLLWVGNAELRVPVARDVEWDVLDHCIGARNVWLAGFTDVGDVYANGHSVGGRMAYAVGAGLRVDVAVFSFIERATLRFDVGKTLNDSTPFQFWFGMQHAF
ncbi:MAG: Peptidase family [Gemmataceae bacterium]|nr:Peptidase family [Gemmataceae bacterium]